MTDRADLRNRIVSGSRQEALGAIQSCVDRNFLEKLIGLPACLGGAPRLATYRVLAIQDRIDALRWQEERSHDTR